MKNNNNFHHLYQKILKIIFIMNILLSSCSTSYDPPYCDEKCDFITGLVVKENFENPAFLYLINLYDIKEKNYKKLPKLKADFVLDFTDVIKQKQYKYYDSNNSICFIMIMMAEAINKEITVGFAKYPIIKVKNILYAKAIECD